MKSALSIKDDEFVHLHVHTEYSLLDGAARIKKLIATACEQGMKALAITDHGVMYGVLDFYKEAKKQGIKPILGCEVYVARRRRFDKEPRLDESPYHLVLLAENEQGYRNLLKLVSLAFMEGFYYKPRVDKDLLRQYSGGLIAMSACIAGEVPGLILKDKPEQAREKALEYQEIFGEGNFYLELQDHGMEEQRKANLGLIDLSRDTGIPLVATNDLHYVSRSDAKVQDVLMCIQTGKSISDTNRMSFSSDEMFLKSVDEMHLSFGEHVEAINNTVKIAERCNVTFDFGQTYLPDFEVPAGHTLDTYLTELCRSAVDGLFDQAGPTVWERLDYELKVISQTGFSAYFLIVADFCAYARANGVTVGPGRGSAAGSLVAYLLGITTVDPLKYGLLFERFLNPERISMPDIDIDFDPDGREKVINYVVEKYGADKVAQIITFGTMAAKAAVRDVGRALGLPLAQVDKVAKLIPGELGITLQRALEISSDLAALYSENPEITELLDLAMDLEGMARHSSTHAAGVVISKEPLMNYLPLQKTSDGAVITQFPMKLVEEIGLLKMDFLGLRNLTIIDEAVKLVKKHQGLVIDINRIAMDEQETYRLLAAGETNGVFQLESSGMRAILKDLKPSVFEDIIAVLALYRPGPMDQIPEFTKRKHGAQISYLHPKLEDILRNTYGIIVYQEQVMQIARDLAGYSLGRADLLRRAMGKKKKEIMDEERRNFVEGLTSDSGEIIISGAVRLGLESTLANSIFDLMAKFAEYGFNKGHATAYAVISYQTAWLKANYPLEFMAALLTSVMGSSDKVSYYIEECGKKGIEILPPDVNESFETFSISGQRVRFGLAAVKNIGLGVVQMIIKEREENGSFTSLRNFCERVDGKALNKRVLESLIRCGAFCSLGLNRAQLLHMLEPSLDAAHARQRDLASGQMSLFDFGQAGPAEIKIPQLDEFVPKEILAMEKELLGLYLSGHPLREFSEQLVGRVTEIIDLAQVDDGVIVYLAGVITYSRKTVTRKGEAMAYFTLEDLNSGVEVLVFPRTFLQIGSLVVDDRMVWVKGRISKSEEETKIFAENIIPLETYLETEIQGMRTVRENTAIKVNFKTINKTSSSNSKISDKFCSGLKVFIKLTGSSSDGTGAELVSNVLKRYPGPTPVFLFYESERKMIEVHPDLRVEFCAALEREIANAFGAESIKVQNG